MSLVLLFCKKRRKPKWTLKTSFLVENLFSFLRQTLTFFPSSSCNVYLSFLPHTAPLLISRAASLLSFLTSVEWLRSSPIFQTTSTFALNLPNLSLKFFDPLLYFFLRVPSLLSFLTSVEPLSLLAIFFAPPSIIL